MGADVLGSGTRRRAQQRCFDGVREERATADDAVCELMYFGKARP